MWTRRVWTLGGIGLMALALGLSGAALGEEGVKVRIKKIACEEGEEGCKGGYLGVGLTELTPDLRTHFGVPEEVGVMVSKVMDETPAREAGLEAGDIITGVDGEPVSSGRELAKKIRAREAGEVVALEVWRDGRVETVTAQVEEREGHHHGQHHGHRAHAYVMKCEHQDEDCEIDVSGFDFTTDFDFDCDDGECEVLVECDEGDCTCTVNGEEIGCEELHGVRHHGVHHRDD
jgi:hypothetical protein